MPVKGLERGHTGFGIRSQATILRKRHLASFSTHLLELRLSEHGPRRVPAEGKFTQRKRKGIFLHLFIARDQQPSFLTLHHNITSFFRSMRIFRLLGIQEPDRLKRELDCPCKKPSRIPNPCRRIPNPPVSVLFSIRTFYEKGLEPEFFNTVRTFMFRLFGLPEFMPCAFHCDERGRRRFPVSSY